MKTENIEKRAVFGIFVIMMTGILASTMLLQSMGFDLDWESKQDVKYMGYGSGKGDDDYSNIEQDSVGNTTTGYESMTCSEAGGDFCLDQSGWRGGTPQCQSGYSQADTLDCTRCCIGSPIGDTTSVSATEGGKTCTDDDGGVNPNVASNNDICVMGTTLNEHICNVDNIGSWYDEEYRVVETQIQIKCQNGCSGGRCL